MVASDGSRPDPWIREPAEAGSGRPPLTGRADGRQEGRQWCLGGDRWSHDLATGRSRCRRWDPAEELHRRQYRGTLGRGCLSRCWTRPRPRACRPDPEPAALDRDLHGAVRVGAVRPTRERMEPLERRRRWMAVRVARTRGHDRDGRPHGLEERPGRRRARPVMRDLQQVHLRQAAGEELGVDPLLDVAGEQEPPASHLAEEHDRDVVDPGAGVTRTFGDPVRVWPEHTESDRVERQPVTGGEPATRRPTVREDRRPRVVAGSGPEHPRLVDPSHPIPLEEQGEPGDVVLVGMREHEHVDPSVPRRQPFVERDEQPARIRAAVDHHPATAPALHEDPVALPDVEDDDPRNAIRPVRHDEGEPHDRTAQCDGGDTKPSIRGPGGARSCARNAGRRPTANHSPPRRKQPATPARNGHDGDQRQGRADRVPGRSQLDAREGQPRADPDDRDHRRVEEPGGQADEDGKDRRQPQSNERAGAQRDCPGGHRRRDQRHDDHVDGRRDERKPPEVEQHDRRRRRLRGQRHAEDLCEPSPQPPRRGT